MHVSGATGKGAGRRGKVVSLDVESLRLGTLSGSREKDHRA